MATDNILRSFGDNSVKTDVVLNAVEILTAKEAQITNLLGKTSAIATVHSYLTDTLLTAASLAVEEGADFTAQVLSSPTRLTNLVEKIVYNYKVTGTQQRIEHYSGDEQARQTEKALMNWGNAYEFDVVRSTLTSGASGTAPKMSGIVQAISKSTNTTTHNSGTVWSATILDALMQANWTNSNGDVATHLYMAAATRATTDTFSQKSNIVVNQPGGLSTIVRGVTTYATSFGTLNVFTHRYIGPAVTATTNAVLAINPEKLKIAFLAKPFIKNLAELGDYSNKSIIGECTLEVRNQDSNWWDNCVSY